MKFDTTSLYYLILFINITISHILIIALKISLK